MKKIFTMILVGAAAVLASVSCNKEEVIEASKDGTVRFYANEIKTKTEFGTPDGNKYPTLWTGNEDVYISLNMATSVKASVTPTGSNKTADFTTVSDITDDGSSNYVFYAVSPDQVSKINTTYNSWTLEIPANQTPSATSVDEAAQILFAKESTGSTFPAFVGLNFKHVTAYGKLSFANLALDPGETVTSVIIKSPVNWVGRWYYYVEDHDTYKAGDIAEGSASKVLTITTNQTSDIWFACAPVDLQSKAIDITVTTTLGSFNKSVTFPSGRGNFEAGKIGGFSVDMSGVIRKDPIIFTLVNDVDELSNNSEVIIVHSSLDFAAGKLGSETYMSQQAITKTGVTIKDPSEEVEVFKIAAGNQSGSISFICNSDSKYLAWSSSTKLTSSETLTDAGSWTVTVDGSGIANIANVKEPGRSLLYNSSAPRFSTYSPGTGYADVNIYKKNGTGTALLPRVTIAGDIEAEASGKNIIVTWTDPVDANVSNYKVTCTGLADQDVTPSDGGYIFENLADGEYVITVTAIAANSSTHRDSNAWTSSTLEISSTLFEEIDLTAQGYSNGATVSTVSGSVATLVFAKGSGSNPPKYYTSGTSVRTYASNTLTVSVPSGKKINSIEFTLGGTKSATVTADSGTLGDISGSSRTWTAGATKPNSVVFTNGSSNQMHYQKVKVYYE